MTDVDGDPYADRGDRTALYDDVREVALVYTLAESTRAGRSWADNTWRPATVAAQTAADAVLAGLSGHALSTSDRDLAAALADAGSSEIRHSHLMSHPLSSVPDASAVPGLDVAPLRADEVARDAERLGEINFRAYPPDHPDHEFNDVASAVREIRGIGLGHILGPFMGQSTVGLVDGQTVGACLVVARDGIPPEGGPWIVDVFRDPGVPLKGVGRALIAATIAQCLVAGLFGLSLVVSHTNANVRALYGALGFIDCREIWTLGLP